jgi:hypothetical protein
VIRLLQDLPSREDAQEAARRELENRAYDEARPPWTYRALMWVVDKIGEALSKAGGVPGGRFGVLLILAVVALLVAVVVVRLRPALRTATTDDLLFDGDQVLTAAQHRLAADAAAASGDFAEAVRERLRAVVRGLEESGVLDPRPGRTALEISAEASRSVPGLAEPLRRGAVAFERIWYGGHTADASAYAVLVAVDEQVDRTVLVRR